MKVVSTASRFFLIAFSVLMVGASVSAQDLNGIKCIGDGESQASADISVDYRGGKVYFCCEGCADEFKSKLDDKDSDLLVKANHQLVLTGQFKQTACPLEGKEVAEGQTVDVGGVKVAFCCSNCQGAAAGLADASEKAKKVFSNEAFEKGFAKNPKLDKLKCFLMPKKDVLEKWGVKYGNHTVYFCCKSCVNRYSKNPENYVVQANQHLVDTEQVKQTKCPISGDDVSDDQTLKVNGTEVKFCCENCKSKVANASDTEKAALVFGKDAFEKGFE